MEVSIGSSSEARSHLIGEKRKRKISGGKKKQLQRRSKQNDWSRPSTEEMRKWKENANHYLQMAIEVCNENMTCNFKPVELTNVSAFRKCGCRTWFHVNFRCELPSYTVNGVIVRNLFFAEMVQDHLNQVHIVSCSLLPDIGGGAGGCEFCRDVVHPLNRYFSCVSDLMLIASASCVKSDNCNQRKQELVAK